MDKKELKQLSKAEVIRYCLFLQEQLAVIPVLEKRVEQLERVLLQFDNENTPSSMRRKNNSDRDDSKPRFPGKPRGGHGGGVKLPLPDETKEYTLDECPDCGGDLKEVKTHTKKILDLPVKPVICTEHRIHEYRCAHCCKDVLPIFSLPVGIYGHRLQSACTLLKKEGLSFSTIAQFFNNLGALTLSAPSVLNFTNNIGILLGKTRGALLRSAKKCFVVHKDETGFRIDGKNGYVGGLFTNNITIYNATAGRTQSIKLFENNHISVVDGYAGYKGIIQRCWSHLMRIAKKTSEDFPETLDQYSRLKIFYQQLKEWVKDPPNTHFEKALWTLNDIAECLNTRTGGRKLATHIKNAEDNWLTALKYRGVPLTNNHAERQLRMVVILRKMMGCYRNDKGRRFINTVLSVLQTAELRGNNTFKLLTTLQT